MHDEVTYPTQNEDELFDRFDSILEPRQIRFDNEDESYYPVLGLLSQRWTATILRRLSFGAANFNLLSKELGVNSQTLSARLRDFERESLVSRTVERELPPKVRYELTPKGIELAKIIVDLHRWIETSEIAPIHAVVHESAEDYSTEKVTE